MILQFKKSFQIENILLGGNNISNGSPPCFQYLGVREVFFKDKKKKIGVKFFPFVLAKNL